MKKIVRWIALGLAALVVIAIAGAYLLPRHPVVTRSIVVDAPPGTVFAVVSDLRQFNDWSPWFDRDPDATYTFTGPTDGVGQKLHWKSDVPEVGSGSMTIDELDPVNSVEISIAFADQGDATSWFEIAPKGAGSEVTWGFSTDLGFNPIGRYFGMTIDGAVGPDYERGLAKLKATVEVPPDSDTAGN